MNKKAKRWMGDIPKVCDICKQEITTTFIDGRTSMGPWALMCPKCHQIYGDGLGPGKGQEYDKKGVKIRG
jgi:hypothetical protein